MRTSAARPPVGDQVHWTETCAEETPNRSTHGDPDEAVGNENDAWPEIQQPLSQAELLPSRQWADAGSSEAQPWVERRQVEGVGLSGPVQGNGRWQPVPGNGFDLAHVEIDGERKKATGPEGKVSASGKSGRETRGNEVIHGVVAKADGSPCPSLAPCPKAKGKRRTLNSKPQELPEALHQARQRE